MVVFVCLLGVVCAFWLAGVWLGLSGNFFDANLARSWSTEHYAVTSSGGVGGSVKF